MINHDLPIIAYHPTSILEKIKAAYWCLSGRVVAIAICIPIDKYLKKEGLNERS